MQPTSFEPPVDLVPYANQLVLVVGCGTAPGNHAGQAHQVPMPGANVDIRLSTAYTMDVVHEMQPHRVAASGSPTTPRTCRAGPST